MHSAVIAGSGNLIKSRFESKDWLKIFSKSTDPLALLHVHVFINTKKNIILFPDRPKYYFSSEVVSNSIEVFLIVHDFTQRLVKNFIF